MIFLVLCVTVHMLTIPRPWKYVLKVITLGRISQESLVLWCLTSSALGTPLPGQSKTFFICEHLWSWCVFPAVCVFPAIGSTCWSCREPSGRWCHLLLKGVGTALPGTMWSLQVESKVLSSAASVYKAFALLSCLPLESVCSWNGGVDKLLVCTLCSVSGMHFYHHVFPIQFYKKKRGENTNISSLLCCQYSFSGGISSSCKLQLLLLYPGQKKVNNPNLS